MTLRDLMAAHVPVLLSTEHFGQDVTVTPKSLASSFTLRCVVGDQADAYAPDGSVVLARATQAILVFQRSAWRTSIAVINAGVARDAKRGDVITVAAAGAYEGTWIIDQTTTDEGDAAQVQLVRPADHQLGGTGAVGQR